ncbi:hypothetical protein ACLESO_43760 [Pyxidicoccus sp. 3LG]
MRRSTLLGVAVGLFLLFYVAERVGRCGWKSFPAERLVVTRMDAEPRPARCRRHPPMPRPAPDARW